MLHSKVSTALHLNNAHVLKWQFFDILHQCKSGITPQISHHYKKNQNTTKLNAE